MRHSACFWLVSSAPSILPFLFSTPIIWLSLCRLLHLSFYLKLFGKSGRNCLPSAAVLSGYNGSLGTRFYRVTTRLMSWPDGERYLRPLQSLVVTFLLSLVFTLFISRTGGVPAHRNSSHRFPRFPTRNLCSLVMITVFSLVYAPTNTAFY